MTETKQNGAAIRAFRESRGYTRDEMAVKIGKSYPYYCNIEYEQKDPPAEVVNKIALALDVPLAAICRRNIYPAERASA